MGSKERFQTKDVRQMLSKIGFLAEVLGDRGNTIKAARGLDDVRILLIGEGDIGGVFVGSSETHVEILTPEELRFKEIPIDEIFHFQNVSKELSARY